MSRFLRPASIILLVCLAAAAQNSDGFVSIFDGRTLRGWRAEPSALASSWSAGNGVIRAEGFEYRLAYLVYTGDENLADFELKFSYRMLTDGNTGVEVRARVDQTGKRPFEGYHADLGHLGIGPQILGAWDFHFATRRELPCERGTSLVINKDGVGSQEPVKNPLTPADINKRDWNHCRIKSAGNNFQFFINGKLASEFTDNAVEGRLDSGMIALQLHDKGMVTEFKDIRLKVPRN